MQIKAKGMQAGCRLDYTCGMSDLSSNDNLNRTMGINNCEQ